MKSHGLSKLILMPGLALIGCTSVPTEFERVTPFKELSVDHSHVLQDGSHPFSAAAVIDVDGDGRHEVFFGGGKNQADALLAYDDKNLRNIIGGSGLSDSHASYAAASIDIDNDGDVDLLVGRSNGLNVYLNDGGHFSQHLIEVDFVPDSVPLGIALSDIDHDGDSDIYISVFVDPQNFRSGVFNDPSHAKPNVLLLNEGNLNFTDITSRSGTAGSQNTFVSMFSDLDNDGWQDLLVAQNTGQVEIFRNNRDLSFSLVDTHSGYGFWMGVAVGDIDNDGDQDVLFSNAGDSIPAALTKGDIREDQRHNLGWALWRNDGGFKFSDVTEQYAINEEGFAWGSVFEDLNLDGRLDLLVAQNYTKWPLHKLFKLNGLTSLQTRDGRFVHIPDLNLENPYFGQSPLVVDINGDSKPDVLWVNMDGPVRAFINQTPVQAISVMVPEEARYLGSRVTLITDRGRSYTREVVSSTGMSTDQTPDLVFGLADGEKALRIEVIYPDGEQREVAITDGRYLIKLNK